MDFDALHLKRLDLAIGSYLEAGGLRLMPIGVLVLAMAPFSGGLIGLSTRWESLIAVWSLLAAMAAFWLVARWYRGAYGRIFEARPDSKRESGICVVLWGAAAAMFLCSVTEAGPVLGLLGSLAGAAVLVKTLLYWRRAGRVHPHSFALMTLVIAGGLLEQPISSTPGGGWPVWLLVLIGAVVTGVGITDHLRLAGVARPLEESPEEDGGGE